MNRPTEQERPDTEGARRSWWPLLVYAGLLALIIFALSSQPSSPSEHVRYSEFMDALRTGSLAEIEISDTRLTGTRATVKEGQESLIWTERIPGLDTQRLIEELEARDIAYSGRIESDNSWLYLLIWFLPLLLIIGFSVLSMRRMRQAQIGGPRVREKSCQGL